MMDTFQLEIFIWGIDNNFYVTEESTAIFLLKSTKKIINIFNALKLTFNCFENK